MTVFTAGLHEAGLAGAIDVPPVGKVGVFHRGMILGVEPHVADRVVEVAVVVEIGLGKRGPPPETSRGPRLLSAVDQLSFLVSPELDRSPFRSQRQVAPTVTVIVGPKGGSDHPSLAQAGRQGIGCVGEHTSLVDQQATAGRIRVTPTGEASTDEEVEIAVPVEIAGRDGSPAVPQVRGIGQADGKPALAVVKVETIAQVEGWNAGGLSTRGHEEIEVSIGIGIEKNGTHVLEPQNLLGLEVLLGLLRESVRRALRNEQAGSSPGSLA